MTSYAFTMPFAVDTKAAHVVLVQRQLIQKRQAGKSVKGIIPEWAGQWGLVGGPIGQNETPEAAAIRTFHEQTGLDLTDSDVGSNFLLQNRSMINLKTENYATFSVQCIFTTMAALSLLQTVITDVIGTTQVSEGTLAGAKVLSMSDARNKIGATPVPSGGWKDVVIREYFDGKSPGQLNTEIDTLTSDLTTAAAQDTSYFTTALSDKETQ
ncbi:NUDIX domain-containing protein [Kordiimonas marina]|uniref:NUDIX domain-containing protein n=1 Tax=Kordiimonas marina TaxID=2872312 RepID=UPI001FF5C875|nr:NUDIX domain-containing protein [Kordiimonas marina]MCJ9429037.1 NUDIX domain-containing protein [Kordiimonas marina]